jgi:hypothetical protein
MKLARFALIGVAAGSFLLCSSEARAGGPKNDQTVTKKGVGQAPRLSSSQTKLQETRRNLIERKKASRDGLKNLVMAYEHKLESQAADYERKREFYEKNLISSRELQESEQAVNKIRLEIERVREWIAEDDIALALSEGAAREKMAGLPVLPAGAYDETTTLIRYNGGAGWSLADVRKIEAFFLERFGYALPISALGQSLTHDRMGLDHRDALDVALRPDSAPGRALIAYLRKSGIPFIAFRNAVRGMATGAHIHIGPPSVRLIQTTPAAAVSPVAEQDADQS